ncbi:Peptidyl-prolyl cis-trans isomerase-like [Oopsacas minuta]|uniref:Peptidyl-prolyl cis-trans isomerase n=1 Tax=Oopsacas minuta TaxID=111878 RepID=A0AAV7KC46_9METZ|nr:Peptidyl-prolyl cis-trans isomerase-like [Oopsacas minuta]
MAAIDRGDERKNEEKSDKDTLEDTHDLSPFESPVVNYNEVALCFIEVSENEEVIGRIVMRIRGDIVPKTCENFRALLDPKGVKDVGSYKAKPFHRVVKDFMVQTGDVEYENGVGRRNLYGVEFDDENFELKHEKYAVSMSNVGPDTNGCIFFILLMDAPWLDGFHVVFGNVIDGTEILHRMSDNSRRSGRMTKHYKIHDCGDLK